MTGHTSPLDKPLTKVQIRLLALIAEGKVRRGPISGASWYEVPYGLSSRTRTVTAQVYRLRVRLIGLIQLNDRAVRWELTDQGLQALAEGRSRFGITD